MGQEGEKSYWTRRFLDRVIWADGVSWANRGNIRNFQENKFCSVVLFWGTCKICRKRNLVGHGIEGDHKSMAPEWKRKMYLWMKLRRGYKESKRMISSKQRDLFSKRSFEKVWVSSNPCYREIRKEPDQNPDCKKFEDEGVSVVIRNNSGGLTEKRQGQRNSRQKFRVTDGSFLSLSRTLLFLPFPPSLSLSLSSFLPFSIIIIAILRQAKRLRSYYNESPVPSHSSHNYVGFCKWRMVF